MGHIVARCGSPGQGLDTPVLGSLIWLQGIEFLLLWILMRTGQTGLSGEGMGGKI